MSTATLSTYAEMTARNLQHMGTPAHEWRVVHITGTTETTNDKGDTVSVPVFAFPAGYTPAPTLYNQQGECGSCSHDIKGVYWIQNDAKRWTLPVGCECVKHFTEGLNGRQCVKKDIANANRELIAKCRAIRLKLRAIYDAKSYREREAVILLRGLSLRACTLGNWSTPTQWIPEFPSAEFYPNGKPHWGDRKIANWLKKYGPALEKLLNEVKEKFPEVFQSC